MAKKLSEQIQEAVATCGMSRYRIAKITGIPQSSLSRFMSGAAGLSQAKLDVIGELLGLELRKTPRKAKR